MLTKKVTVILLTATVAHAADPESWLAKLRSPSRQVRLEAAWDPQILRNADEPFILALLSHVRDPDPNVRARILGLFGETGFLPSQTLPVLTKALSDEDPIVRKQATIALARVGSPALEELLNTLQQVKKQIKPYPEPSEAELLGIALSGIGLDTIKPILATFHTLPPLGKSIAIRVIKQLAPEFPDNIVQPIFHSGDDDREAVFILANAGLPLVPPLLRIFEEDAGRARQRAAEALAYIYFRHQGVGVPVWVPDEHFQDYLGRYDVADFREEWRTFSDPNRIASVLAFVVKDTRASLSLRAQAIVRIGELARNTTLALQASNQLSTTVQDAREAWPVRESAARGLRGLPTTLRQVDVLRSVLLDRATPWPVKRSVALTLGAVGSHPSAVILDLERATRDGNSLQVRAASACALGELGQIGLPSLNRLLGTGDSTSRALAAIGLGAKKDANAALLKRLSEDGDRKVALLRVFRNSSLDVMKAL